MKNRIHHFKAPILSGPDGNPLEIPDSLAERLRRSALDEGPQGEDLFSGLDSDLAEALLVGARNIDGESIEHGLVISDGGQILYRKRGFQNRVSVDEQILRGANFLHNHPDGKPLSFEDLEALFESGLNSVWAVGGGWLYGATVGLKGKDSSVGDLRVASSFLSEAAFAVINDLFLHDPSIEPGSLGTRHMHAVLSELAENGLLNYCRVRHGVRR